jgi:hypothetical protein
MNKQVKTELAFAFSQMHKKHLKLVPKELIKDVLSNVDKEIFNSFDEDKPFTKQNLSEETLEIIAKIFKDIPEEKF